MEGFFTKKETASKTRPDGKSYSCAACGLYRDCKNPRIKPYGNFKKKILNIGEAPGEYEDLKGKPWQGKTGRLLKQTYEKLGIDLFNDCLNINAVLCRPTTKDGDNRAPTNYEAECCRKSILKLVNEYKPKVIVLFGNTAVFSLIGHRWKKDLGGIMKWRGWQIPDQDFNAWICPTFHPNYVHRAKSNPYNYDGRTAEETIWVQDLREAILCLKTPFPVYQEPVIKIIKDLSILNKIKAGSKIAFDYETTGLKPHAFGHRIVCCSVAVNANKVYVFMMPQKAINRVPFIRIIEDEGIGKIAANMKFEDNWSFVRLKTEVKGWLHDTMQGGHILDNRQGITGLKFQTYVQFGVVDYASDVAPYLSSTDPKNGNSLNRIMELVKKPGGKELLMKYCGYDSINEYRLAEKQIFVMGEAQLPF